MRLRLIGFTLLAIVLASARDEARAGGFGSYIQDRGNSLGKGLAQFDRGRVAVMTSPATYQAAGTAVGGYYGGAAGASAGSQIGGTFGNGVAGRPARGSMAPPPPPYQGGYPAPGYPPAGYPPAGGYPPQGYDPQTLRQMQSMADRQHQQEMETMRLRANLQRQDEQRQFQYSQQVMQQQRQFAQQQEEAALVQGIFNTVNGVVQGSQSQQYDYGP